MMKVQFKEFAGRVSCQKAAAFASEVGKDRLIGISQLAKGGLEVAVVWYWA